MRSRDDEVDRWVGAARALSIGVCGMGGRLRSAPTSLDEAIAEVADEHDDRTASRLARFGRACDGSWVWTCEAAGVFRLGMLVGGWRYDATVGADQADLVHVRPCDWHPSSFAEHEVPAAVAHTFRRGGRNFQRIDDPAVPAESERLWRPARR